MKKNLPLSYIEISKNNLIKNLQLFKKIAKKGTKFSVVIKGNAYGHGQNEIVKILEPLVDYFQVDSIEELILLRKNSKKKVFVLGYVQKADIEEAIKLGCILSAFSFKELFNINTFAKKLHKIQEVHIPVDAHLGREGFLPNMLPKLFIEIKKCKNVKLTGIYAHFANIEDTNNFTHAEKQIKRYEEAISLAEKYGFTNLDTHISATSGLLVYEGNKGIHPIIRLGIGVYGLWPSEHIKFLYKNKLKLFPVLSWKTHIALVKNLPAGHTVGYGLSFTTYKTIKIAVIPQGYADGYKRSLSNEGEVLIRGKKCKVLGRVAMNMFVVDVTNVKDVKDEDEVVLLGTQGKNTINAESLAEMAGTINYEVTSRISALLPRIIV